MILRSIRVAALATMTLAASTWFVPSPAAALSGNWTAVSGLAQTPSPRREFGSVYDPVNQRFLIFCGATTPYQLFNELWVLTLSGTPTWTHVNIPGTVPGERHSPQWGYDAARNRVLIFGGYGRHLPGQPYAYLNDVWQLSLDGTPQWTELHPSGQTPAGRLAGAAVYDPMRQRFVGFGGTVGTPVDTWVLNLRGQANWQQLPIDGARPNGGYGMASAYDAKRDRMLIFGGTLDDQYYGAKNDVWELSLRGLPRWNLVSTTGTKPAARRSGTAIFDPIRDRMVIYGGFNGLPESDIFLGDTWALSFGGTPTWSELSPAGTVPSVRVSAPAGYDPIADRMVIFGGWSGASMLNDTQFLTWGGTSNDALLTHSSSASPTAAHVEWEVGDATGRYAAVYRRDPGGEWSSLAEAEVDLNNRITFEDPTVVPGTQYDYMMVVGSERGETFGGLASVQVPSSLDVAPGLSADIALGRVSPNPVVNRMSVGFTLASQASANIELLDVTGRLMMSRDVSSYGAGAHRIELSPERQLPEGLYFLRLTQAGRTASSRVVVTRAQ